MWIYLIGVVGVAFFYGFQSRFGARDDNVRAVVTVLAWPIMVVVAAGEASRIYSLSRYAEDLAAGMEPSPSKSPHTAPPGPKTPPG